MFVFSARHLAVILLTIPLARYRIPYVLAVTPFAGFAVAELTRWVLTGRWWPATGGLAAVLALAVWTNGPRPDDAGRLRAVDYTVTIEHFFGPQISAAESKGDWTAKARLLGELIQLQPGEILTWGPHRPPPDENFNFASRGYNVKRIILHKRRGSRKRTSKSAPVNPIDFYLDNSIRTAVLTRYSQS